MKKLIVALLSLTILLSMTAIVSATSAEEVPVDLKGATCTMIDQNDQDIYDYMIYVTGDVEVADNMMPMIAVLGNQLRASSAYYPGQTDPCTMGLYETNGTTPVATSTITYTFTPQIKGFNSETKYQLLVYNSMENVEEWEVIESSLVNNKIVVTKEGNGAERFALVVDRDTLDPNGTEPARAGNEVNCSTIIGKDPSNQDVGLAVYAFIFEDEIGKVDGMFDGLFEQDLFFTLISGEDGDVQKDDLKMMYKMQVLTMGDPTFPVTVTFTDASINEDSKVFILHDKGQEDDEWELVPNTPGEGFTVATFTSLSPVVIYADATTLNGSTPLSPVTGDSDLIYVLIIGLIALVSIGLVARKSN